MTRVCARRQRAADAPFAHNANALQASFSSAQRVWRKQAAQGGASAKAPPVGCTSIGRVKRSKQRRRPACRGIPGQGIHARGSHTAAHAAAHDLSRVVNNNVADYGAGDMLRVTQHETHQAMHAAGDRAPARRLLAQSAPARNFPRFQSVPSRNTRHGVPTISIIVGHFTVVRAEFCARFWPVLPRNLSRLHCV